MRLLGWALTQHDWGPYKKGKFGHIQTHTQGEQQVKMKAEMRVMHPQAKEPQRWQQTTRSQARGLEQVLPPSPQKEHSDTC